MYVYMYIYTSMYVYMCTSMYIYIYILYIYIYISSVSTSAEGQAPLASRLEKNRQVLESANPVPPVSSQARLEIRNAPRVNGFTRRNLGLAAASHTVNPMINETTSGETTFTTHTLQTGYRGGGGPLTTCSTRVNPTQ